MKTYFRLILTFVVVLFALLTTALSCGKKGDGNAAGTKQGIINMKEDVVNTFNTDETVTDEKKVTRIVNNASNSNYTDSENTSDSTGTSVKKEKIVCEVKTPEVDTTATPRIPVAAGLENFVITINNTCAKLEGGAIYINGAAIGRTLRPALSDANANNRGVARLADLIDNGDPGAVNVPSIFTISIKNVTGGIMLLQPISVTRDTLAYTTPATSTGYPPQLYRAPVATTIYRTYNWVSDIGPYVWNTFGDLRHTDPNGAQGVFYCRGRLTNSGINNQDGPLTGGQILNCRFASINNAVNRRAEVDEAWVASTETTKVLRLRLFGIDTGAKTVPNLGAPSITSGLDFANPIPNAVIQQIMNANTYYESLLTIKIVNDDDF